MPSVRAPCQVVFSSLRRTPARPTPVTILDLEPIGPKVMTPHAPRGFPTASDWGGRQTSDGNEEFVSFGPYRSGRCRW